LIAPQRAFHLSELLEAIGSSEVEAGCGLFFIFPSNCRLQALIILSGISLLWLSEEVKRGEAKSLRSTLATSSRIFFPNKSS
jgi:hypothetical protein